MTITATPTQAQYQAWRNRLSEAWRGQAPLSPSTIRTGLRIGHLLYSKQYHPNLKAIVAEAGLSESTVHTALHALENRGFLEVMRDLRGNYRFKFIIGDGDQQPAAPSPSPAASPNGEKAHVQTL